MPSGSSWRVRIEPVGAVDTLISRLGDEAGGHPVLFGVDAPIGLPLAYARRHVSAYPAFPAFLRNLTGSSEFFEVCEKVEEVTGTRPFFPRNHLGSPRRSGQSDRLGVASHEALLRRCDIGEGRRSAACLFWTLGANQVGKAALCLWRDVLLPACRQDEPPALWPFDGDLRTLLDVRRVTIAETYPAEALRQLGLAMAGSKRRPADRMALAAGILAAIDRLHAGAEPKLQIEIGEGFGTRPDGEDRFDCLVGLLGMLAVVQHSGSDGAPPDDAIRHWEGWILGQRAASF